MEKALYRNAVRSRRLIHDAFLQLMLKKDFTAIRAKEVIELADVSKGTFYAHYTGLQDVLKEVEEEYLALLFQVVDARAPELILEDFFPLFLSGLREMERERAVYRLLFQSGYGDSFLQKLRGTFLAYLVPSGLNGGYFVDEEHARVYLTFVAGGAIALIQEWMRMDYPISAEEMARYLNWCILEGIGSSPNTPRQGW